MGYKTEEDYYRVLERTSNAPLSREERKELALMLSTAVAQRAFTICLNDMEKQLPTILNFDLSTEKGRIDASKMQGRLSGGTVFMGLLIDLVLDKESEPEAPQPPTEEKSA